MAGSNAGVMQLAIARNEMNPPHIVGGVVRSVSLVDRLHAGSECIGGVGVSW